MDASPAGSDSSTENDQIQTVVVSVNAVSNHAEKVTSSVKTSNGSTIIISHSSGTTSPLTGMSKICTGGESGSTVVSNELKLSNVKMPPTSNSVIQTCINPLNTVTSSPAAGLGGGLTVTLVKPCMQTAGSYNTLNGDTCTENVKAPNEPLTSAPFRSIQTPLLNTDQSPSFSVPANAGSHIVKKEAVQSALQTIIKTEPQTVPPIVTNAANLTPGIIINNPLLQSTPKTCTPVIAAASPGGIRAIAPQVLAPRLSQTSQNQPNLQNIQLPPGMVLVRTDSGQLMMIHQQILSQMQASRLAAPTSTPHVQITSAQTPGTSILPRQVPPTVIKQESPALTSAPATITLQRPQVLQSPTGAALPGTSQQTVSPSTGTTVTLATETMENVKKCKNFLSTLIKLASSGKQSSETAENVKYLVKDLLDGKIEPEDFTSKLYKELNSSPQPYLVPFLKRSLPALRQLTPDSATFIQQSQQPAHTTSTPSPTPMVVLGSPAPHPAASASRSHPVISKQGHPASLVHQGTIVRPPQVTLATTSMVALRGQAPSGLMLGQPQVQYRQLQQVPMARPGLIPGFKTMSGPASLATAAQKYKLRGAGAGTFREEDDINDVASMAGVNLSEERARILATNSVLVGAVTRSCKDEAFLHTATLQRRILEIGKRCGGVELGPEVVTFLSHATEQRLRNLLERVTEVAQHKNIRFKEDSRYEQKSDARAQLKFFEQLEQVEKQRKEEQEREILMKAAKSRARQEDPEQLRLKQKAKEMQQQELAQMRQREANLTALAAIGSRKKRKLGSAASPAGAEGSGFSPSVSGGPGSAASRQFSRQRITRVNLRDLLFCLENERESNRSQLIYKGFLK